MDKNIEVAIIIPIYNVEKYIEKCLRSVQTQTYKNIKIWAINDGSTDNSLEIVRKQSQNDDRIVVVNKENGGYGSVLEYAISKIKSDFFLVCDSDDWLSSDAVEVLLENALKNNSDIVIGNRYDVYNDDSKEVKFVDVLKENRCIDSRKIYMGKECSKAAFCDVSPHSKLFRTQICKNILFEHNVSYTDTTLFLVALNNCNVLSCTEKALSYYLCDRPGNTVTDKNPRKIEYLIKVWHSTFNQLKESNNPYLLFSMYLLARLVLWEYSTYREYEVIQYKSDIYELFNMISLKRRNIFNSDIRIGISFCLFTSIFRKNIVNFYLLRYGR